MKSGVSDAEHDNGVFIFCVFFFQAEDGIRDYKVTGVQTCALPISLMAMVAKGIGWAVTTPLGFMRAGRFHDQVEAFALPIAPFSRTISLFASADWAGDVPMDVANTMRRLIQTHMIDPAMSHLPWLAGEFRLLDS